MKYTIYPEVFELSSDIVVYLLVARGLKNRPGDEHDEHSLRHAEAAFQGKYGQSDIRSIPSVAAYRGLMEKAGINPNRYPPSIEAMLKRIAKGGRLPMINAIVDRLNAISLRTHLSMGAHDMRGIKHDLTLRLSTEGDRFLPLGSERWEEVAPGELTWLSGSEVQTRRGLWRQSELAKTELDSTDIYFHLVGFSGFEQAMDQAVSLMQELIDQLGGRADLYRIDREQPVAQWADSMSEL